MKTTRSLLLLLAALVTLGCPKPVVQMDAGAETPDAGEEFDAGTPVVDAGRRDAGVVDAGPPPELKVLRLLPPRGPAAGGTSVLLEGSGFLRDFAGSGTQAKPLTAIKFGSNPVLDYQIIDDETLELRVPQGALGATSVSIVNPNGRAVCNNCFTYFEDLAVTGFTPRSDTTEGGAEVTLTGKGFTANTQVLFGDFASPAITFVSGTTLKAIVPRASAAGLVDLNVYNQNGAANLRRAFTYLAPPRLTAVEPASGSIAGGTMLTLRGRGFTGATAVKFGADSVAFTVVSDSVITIAATPAHAAGAVDLTIETPVGRWTARNAFTFIDEAGAFWVFALYPHVISTDDRVTITGQLLDTATGVTIGGVNAPIISATFGALTVRVPPRGSAPRKSDVVVTHNTDAQTLTQAATWRATLLTLTPNEGPEAGGTAVAVTARALPPQATVSLGTFAPTAVMLTSETALSFTTPRGASGPANALVVRDTQDPENEAILTEAFTFNAPLSIGRVTPDRGAVAGNGLVTVLGSGFGDATTVSFGANRAKDIKIVDSHTLTCRTPKGTVGTVDVRVERLTQRDTLAGGFSYFDPRSISGGLSGGPLVGTLNVTVLDSTQGNYGAPISQATVILGLDSSTPFQGDTDARGQVTLSDPSLVKAQVVTVFKENFETVTVTGVDAENLTVFMSRTGGGEPSSGQPPPGTPPSQISGRVTGFKAPRPLMQGETLEARVFVAQTSLFGGAPFRGAPTRMGETWKVMRDGDSYLVLTGAGLRAVYALLGVVGASGTFTPFAMGVKRGITTSADSPAINQLIVIDMSLDLTVPITIDSPLTFPSPLGGSLPGTNKVYAWLDLGAEGFIPNPNNWASGTGGASSVSSSSPSLMFPNFPQLDGSNFIFLNQTQSPQFYPDSYYFRRQPGPMSMGVTIGPMLPGPAFTAPSLTFNGHIAWSQTSVGPTPNIHNLQIMKQTPTGLVSVWNMVLPGSETQVDLPAPAVQALHQSEAGNTLLVVMYSSRAPKFSYNQWTYDTLSGVSWSSFTIGVSSGFTP